MEPVRMSEAEKLILKNKDLVSEPITVLQKRYNLKQYRAEGVKSVVWIGVDDFSGVPVAVKFSTRRDYYEQVYLAEIKKAATLNSYSQFAKYFGAEEKVIKGIECVVFIEEWIEGETLRSFKDVTASFIESYIKQFCIILNILKINKLRHDDLNLGNVVITPPLPGDYRNEFTIKVVDMGSLKDYDTPLKKSKVGFDDLKRFCTHLVELSNRLLFENGLRRPISRKEKLYRAVIKKILPQILEDDNNVSLHDPEKIQEVFLHEFAMSLKNQEENISSIDTPFDYISADHIGSDVLLNELFATSCPWLSEVKNNTPVLLTGPRGCGKSMIFRWLSFKSILARKDDNALNNASIIGFYISCSADLRNRFSLYDTINKTAQAKEEIIHYFNLLITREIVFTLSLMSHYQDHEEFFGLSQIIENEIYTFIINSLNLERSKTYLQGTKPFEHLYDIIIREMNDCYRYMLKRTKVPTPTALSYLSDLTSFLKKKLPFFSNRTITFLLDDYSLHRISEPVQIILNPILWERQANHIFKVSSEKFGMVLVQDNNSNTYSPTSDITREYREIDVGERYVNLSDKDGSITDLITFCTELLNHRLKLAKYAGTAENLIGNSNYPDYNTLEKTLRFKTKDQKKVYDEYHGIQTISKICSGDISALLEMYRRIFKEGEVNAESISQIAPIKQHKAIQSTSRAFFDIIKTFNYGEEMYDLVNSFGNLSRKILQEGRLQTNSIPNVTTRIEVDELEDFSKWKSEQRDLFLELIHRSIFISLEQGRGRRTLGSTLRLQLRRIYCPHFKTGLTKTVAIKLTNAEFKFFLSDPNSFCDGEFEKRWNVSTSTTQQGLLNFNDDEY
jgi:serine/threonine protein kinase